MHKFLVSKFSTSLYTYPHRRLFLPPKCFLTFSYILPSQSRYLTLPNTIYLSSLFIIPNHLSLVGTEQFLQYQEISKHKTAKHCSISDLIRKPSEKYIQKNSKRSTTKNTKKSILYLSTEFRTKKQISLSGKLEKNE